MDNTKKLVTVFSQRCAGYLMYSGFVLIDMRRDEKYGTYKNLFFFKNSPQIMEKIEEFNKRFKGSR